jgi:uncharacterized cupredoxin-like copper-binding protein
VFVGTVAVMFVLGLSFSVVGRGLAQEATPSAEEAPPGRPAHIHAGTCDTLDPNPAFPLTNVAGVTGTASGPAAATPVETSFTTVAVDLATLLASENAINVHLSPEEADVYIACGEIGGVLDGAGALSIGLRQQNDSGFSGIAFLSPNAADPAQTDVSVFLAEGLAGGAVGGEDAAEEDADTEDADTEDAAAEEDSAATGGEVAVTLTEFTIDMPTELPAGPTTFTVTNDGEFPHSIEIEGEGVEAALEANLEPGDSGTLEVDLAPGTYEVYCPVGNHAEQGMTLELTVT